MEVYPLDNRLLMGVPFSVFAVVNWDARTSHITDLEMILPGIDF